MKKLLVPVTLTMMTAAAKAAVIITFEQVGDDVRIEANGTLALNPSIVDSSLVSSNNTHSTGLSLVSVRDFAGGGNRYVAQSAGSASSSSLNNPTISFPASDGVGNGIGVFGFVSDRLLYDSDDITGGSLNAVSQLTWNGNKDFFVIEDMTLSAIGADDLDNFVAWIATTTLDTISLNTVPEPSTALLSALGGLGLLARRKR